jgi:hypothetical protein
MVAAAENMRMPSTTNNGAGPKIARENPPAAGIINLITLKAIEFNAKAFIRLFFGTITASSDILAGSFMTHEIPTRNTKMNKFQMLAYPMAITTV